MEKASACITNKDRQQSSRQAVPGESWPSTCNWNVSPVLVVFISNLENDTILLCVKNCVTAWRNQE